jgi:4'-phosphopantetheinyl transferase
VKILTDTPMQIKPNEIHIWASDLAITETEENKKFSLLSLDERKRANQFHFPIHRQRFIAARSMLRIILSHYLNVASHDIVFAYDEDEKPYLQYPNDTHLQFNLSHSDCMAVYAFTIDHSIGIDIEKIQDDYHSGVAQRFFSEQENQELLNLPSSERIAGFYRIWARKEAIVKAIGKGLSIPLTTFSVSAAYNSEIITLENQGSWSLIPLLIHPAYQAAVATNQTVTAISFWKYFDQSPKLDKVYNL